MAKVFSITIPKNEITLNASRKGEAAYSVTNISDLPQKGQAVAHPAQPNIESWFKITDPQRDFPIGRSTEVLVQINVPRSAAQGTYGVELDIIRDGTEPLEDRTDQGQGLTFIVGPAEGWFRWWMAAAAGGVLLLIIALVLIFSNRQAVVPNLAGMDPTQAAQAIGEAGLAVGSVSKAPSASVGAGLVAGSTPGARAELARGSRVDLVISDGSPQVLVTVPNLAQMTLEQARATLAGLGLVVGSASQANDPSIPNGQVISSSPAAGQKADPGSAVNLVISRGPGSTSGNLELNPVDDAMIYQPACSPNCSDSKEAYLVLEDGASSQFSFGMMRFDFGGSLSSGAKLSNATLGFTVEKFDAKGGVLDMYIVAATQKWSGTKAEFACGGVNAHVQITQSNFYKVDLLPLFDKDRDNVLNYGVCLVVKGSGIVVIDSSESPEKAQRPVLYISYQK